MFLNTTSRELVKHETVVSDTCWSNHKCICCLKLIRAQMHMLCLTNDKTKFYFVW